MTGGPPQRNLQAVQSFLPLEAARWLVGPRKRDPSMRRVVLVSNRVIDLRKAPQAGGVAVALADITRTHEALWFGWNGEIVPDEQADKVSSEGRLATVPLSE